MKKLLLLLLLSISLVLISGCSNEISPQEKRNNFDACIIDYNTKNPYSDSEKRRNYESDAEANCVKFLK